MSDNPDHLSLIGTVGAPREGSVGAELAPKVGLDAERAELIATALSVYLCTANAPLVNGSNALCHTLGKYARIGAGGKPPIDTATDWGAVPRPTGQTVLHRLGLEVSEVRDAWQQGRRRDGVGASLSAEFLLQLFPIPYWSVLSQIIDEGPGLSADRLQATVEEEAGRKVAPTRKRPEGGYVSQGYLDNLALQAKRLLSVLVDLRARQHPASSGPLEPWTSLPKMDLNKARIKQATDTTSPPLGLLREVYGGLDTEIEELLGVPLDQQAGAAKNVDARTSEKLFRRLRTRVLLGALATVGMRIGALSELTVADLHREHVCPDGSVGPALALRPKKTLDAAEVRFKPIPVGLMQVIDALLAFREACIGHDLPPEEHLLPTYLAELGAPWSPRLMTNFLAHPKKTRLRLVDGTVKEYENKPLLPRPGCEVGYSAHTVRGAVTQMIRSPEAAAWLERNRELVGDARMASTAVLQVMIAEALTDHSQSLDSLGYGGGNKNQDRERLSMVGTTITWELLTGDAGARKVHDAVGLRSNLHKLVALEGELARLDQEMARCVEEAEAGRADAVTGVLRLHRMTAEKDRVQNELRRTETEIKELKHNPDRLIPVPNGAQVEPVDVEALEREVLNGELADSATRGKLPAVREWITPAELAEILEIGTATVRRWMEGRFPRNVRPWDPDHPPIDDSLGQRRRRLVVSGLNPALFDSDAKRQHLRQLLARQPEGWSAKQVKTPLAA